MKKHREQLIYSPTNLIRYLASANRFTCSATWTSRHFCFNFREEINATRFLKAVSCIFGKRLTFSQLLNKLDQHESKTHIGGNAVPKIPSPSQRTDESPQGGTRQKIVM
jgi:hypothetical protein